MSYRTLFRNKGIAIPLNLRTQQALEKYQLRKILIKPAFSYRLLGINTPAYAVEKLNINFELNEYPKLITTVAYYRTNFTRRLNTDYAGYMKLYTDGSKREAGVGAAVTWNGRKRSATLPREASIFSAEMHTISMAVNIIAEETTETKFVIMSDSQSVLKALRNLRTANPVAKKVIHDVHRIQAEDRRSVKFCWVPGHVGVAGNEEADRAAGAAAARPEEYIGVEYKDWYPLKRKKILEDWTDDWRTKKAKIGRDQE